MPRLKGNVNDKKNESKLMKKGNYKIKQKIFKPLKWIIE